MPVETSPTSPAVDAPVAVSRRLALRGTVVAGVGIPLLAACGGESEPTGTADSATSPGAPADSGGSSGGGSFASTSDIPEGGGVIFAEEGVVVTQPAPGEFKGFTNVCTHRQCPLAEVSDTINCRCHGSMFSIEDGAAVGGPATVALSEAGITVDGDAISLA